MNFIYHFTDGRPAPLGPRETIRRQKQKDLAVCKMLILNDLLQLSGSDHVLI